MNQLTKEQITELNKVLKSIPMTQSIDDYDYENAEPSAVYYILPESLSNLHAFKATYYPDSYSRKYSYLDSISIVEGYTKKVTKYIEKNV